MPGLAGPEPLLHGQEDSNGKAEPALCAAH